MKPTKAQLLLQKLVETPSTKDKPEALEGVIRLAQKQLNHTSLQVDYVNHNGVPSLVAYKKGSQKSKLKLLLNAHLDVVPAKEELFQYRQDSTKAYGRGVYDMKAAAAVMITLISDLASANALPNDVALMLVTDEEIGGTNGTKYLLEEKKYQTDFFIAGEPTNLDICHKQKGILWLEITQKGTPAHGSKPWEGVSSNIEMAKKITAFYQKFPSPKKPAWETTYNLSLLHGGSAQNVVPDTTVANMDIRWVETDKPAAIVKKVATAFEGAEVNVQFNEPCLNTDANHQYIRALQETAKTVTTIAPKLYQEHFASDGRYYSSKGIPTVNFGPLGGGIHQDNEWIDLKSLDTYYQIMKAFITKF